MSERTYTYDELMIALAAIGVKREDFPPWSKFDFSEQTDIWRGQEICKMSVEQLRIKEAHRTALGHLHAIMFGLENDHVVQPHLLVVEAFLQRQLFAMEMEELKRKATPITNDHLP